MARGKSINLSLMDGDANGMIKCTLANWIGIAYRIWVHFSLDKCKNRASISGGRLLYLASLIRRESLACMLVRLGTVRTVRES